MKKKKTPLKPDRPITTILFKAEGGVEEVKKLFPREKELLEREIANSFIKTLKFDGLDFDLAPICDEPADFKLIGLEGNEIEVQLVELMEYPIQQKNDRTEQIAKKIVDDVDLLKKYNGYVIALISRPEINNIKNFLTKKSKFFEELKSFLLAKPDIIGLINYRFIYNSKETLSITIKHHSYDWKFLMTDGEPNKLFVIPYWSTIHAGHDSIPLYRAIEKKLKKKYDTDREFWLLIYSTEMGTASYGINDELSEPVKRELAAINRLMNEEPHKFKQAWFIYPVYDELKCTNRIWPYKFIDKKA